MDLGDIATGTALKLAGETFLVLQQQHVKMGRGGAVVKAKLKNLATGAVIDRTIKPSDPLTTAEVERRPATYLYATAERGVFMDASSFDQFEIPLSSSNQRPYLKDGAEVTVLWLDDQPVSFELPIKLDLLVVATPPNVKGNTATGGTKPATLETGAVVTVPLFIKEGDTIKVNTTDNSYVERVS